MIGQKISHYRITERVSEGGMGTVYKALDLTLERTVAVKVITPSHRDPRIANQRFIREAQAVARIDHPNVVTFYDVVQKGDANFLVMQFVTGVSLREKLREGPLEMSEAFQFGCEIASGLQAAHEIGVVHRDIKPENVMVDSNGHAKVLDFGVAHLVDRSTLTGKGRRIIGTLPYMAPEQIQGHPVDSRVDVYSLGAVIFEMITGKLPFESKEEAALFYQILNEDPPALASVIPDVPDGVDDILAKALAKRPDRRYQTVAEMLHDLEVARSKIESPPPVGERLYARSRKRRRRLILAVVIPMILLGIAAVLITRPEWIPGWPSEPPPEVTTPVLEKKHLAVLPFANVGGDPANKPLCDGLVEVLTTMITGMEQFQEALWVVPASEVRRGEVESVADAQGTFGVNLVITGSVQRFADGIRLTLNLVDAVTQRQIRSTMIESRRIHVSSLQDETVVKVAEMLNVELEPQDRRLLTAGSTRVPGAYEYYVQGLGYLQRYETAGNIDHAIRLFEQAIAHDTRYALAYAGLGEAAWQMYDQTKNPKWVEKAQSYCNQAARIDDNLAPVHATLGIIHRGQGRYDDAVREFQRALTIDPANADAYRGLALTYQEGGQLDKAESTYQKAIELRPGYWGGYSHLGYFYLGTGDFEKAETMYKKVIELTPDNIRGYNMLIVVYFYLGDVISAEAMYKKSIAIKPSAVAHTNMAAVYIYLKRYDDAIPVLEGATQLGVEDPIIWGNLADAYRYSSANDDKAVETYRRAIRLCEAQLEVNPNSATQLALQALFYAKTGDIEKALELIRKALDLQPDDWMILIWKAIILELSGDRDAALDALRDALEHGAPLEAIEDEPEFEDLRKDPRYKELIEQ
ncbi:MAG: tetratricopeptide repeat protein [Candidatus Latescibacterota bacterium]|nr:MAG: tetratricopeptide repeat protein [Candidatus Latescibacterota bacterium]